MQASRAHGPGAGRLGSTRPRTARSSPASRLFTQPAGAPALAPEQQQLVWSWQQQLHAVEAAALERRRQDPAGRSTCAMTSTRPSPEPAVGRAGRRAGAGQGRGPGGRTRSGVGQAAAAARARGLAGRGDHREQRLGDEPFLTFATNRAMRKKAWDLRMGWAATPARRPTTDRSSRKSSSCAERSKLLGFATFAHWRVADRMAGKPENAIALMEALLKPAIARMGEEVADMKAIAARRAPPREEQTRISGPGTTATTPRRSARRSTTSPSPR